MVLPLGFLVRGWLRQINIRPHSHEENPERKPYTQHFIEHLQARSHDT